MYFDKHLCLFNIEASNQEQVLTQMAQMLLTNGVVKPDFLDGILQREQQYPTGLLVNSTGFALPHTDSSRVNQSQICFASLKQPVIFSSMTDENEKIPVKFIFMLAMKQPHEQVENLQNLIGLFQNEQQIKLLEQCHSINQFTAILNEAGVK
ncbi:MULTISPECIES: PTS sugar transporter subunit IIA [unclassified Gilliamella]|uniref:PTS sugar transporter subunit IIA n=1 Tax=unclassified Gilliamella TaxID=2685620 RepID=UPI0013292001|nr:MULTISPECIES: PTS sugar transporter subunit IIA [unclassified Gilliamella]MWN30923.1 PTS sugar transporter subunit IIA [Gilliamella sp. Pra-s60]MWP28512.1 PTS sugar transporter subunit IIA [Gilliamella sp. Pra-s54]